MRIPETKWYLNSLGGEQWGWNFLSGASAPILIDWSVELAANELGGHQNFECIGTLIATNDAENSAGLVIGDFNTHGHWKKWDADPRFNEATNKPIDLLTSRRWRCVSVTSHMRNLYLLATYHTIADIGNGAGGAVNQIIQGRGQRSHLRM